MRCKNILDAEMAWYLNLLKEMKKVRDKGEHSDLAENVDGAESEEAIAEKFREVYEALYNSAETTTDMLRQTMNE